VFFLKNDFLFSDYSNYYPPAIPRTKVQFYFPWISAKRMANLDGLGRGPKQAYKNGRAVIYPTRSFLEWLDSRNSKILSCDRDSGSIKNKYQPEKSKRGRKTKAQQRAERLGR
jgi:hypothetical protein